MSSTLPSALTAGTSPSGPVTFRRTKYNPLGTSADTASASSDAAPRASVDGLGDDIYRALRGRPLLAEKRRLIEMCGELDTPMSLTATVTSGVNDDRLVEIADLLFQYDHILSVMFQPAV